MGRMDVAIVQCSYGVIATWMILQNWCGYHLFGNCSEPCALEYRAIDLDVEIKQMKYVFEIIRWKSSNCFQTEGNVPKHSLNTSFLSKLHQFSFITQIILAPKKIMVRPSLTFWVQSHFIIIYLKMDSPLGQIGKCLGMKNIGNWVLSSFYLIFPLKREIFGGGNLIFLLPWW